uniref:Uncharacterized protein n=1 Tax=Bracon brevicornis TaxID=1563983 RepID=A0A6V7KRP0_9HYME
MLSNHGCFKAYLHRLKHEEMPHCSVGRATSENAEQAFECPRYDEQRRELKSRVETTLEPESLVMIQTCAVRRNGDTP